MPGSTCARSAPTTTGPIVIGGTKWPSITSMWMTLAPAAMTSSTCAPRRAKSADRIEGATWMAIFLNLDQHGAAAMAALQHRSGGHPDDRRMLTAVVADRPQLDTVQAVDTAGPPGPR